MWNVLLHLWYSGIWLKTHSLNYSYHVQWLSLRNIGRLPKRGVLVEEGSLNENTSSIVNPYLIVEKDEEQRDLTTRHIVALQVFSTNFGDAIKELKKEQEKENLRMMFVEMGLNPTNFEQQITNVVEQQNQNFNTFGMFFEG